MPAPGQGERRLLVLHHRHDLDYGRLLLLGSLSHGIEEQDLPAGEDVVSVLSRGGSQRASAGSRAQKYTLPIVGLAGLLWIGRW